MLTLDIFDVIVYVPGMLLIVIDATPFSFVLAQFIAFLDETVQIFVGRGPEITDVWIDVFGFSALFAITIVAAFTVRVLMNKLRKNKQW